MMHLEASPFVGFGLQGSGFADGNDPAFLRDPVPHSVEMPRTTERPADWSEEPSAWQMVADLADHLGYRQIQQFRRSWVSRTASAPGQFAADDRGTLG
jgi:hypothetical protein